MGLGTGLLDFLFAELETFLLDALCILYFGGETETAARGTFK